MRLLKVLVALFCSSSVAFSADLGAGTSDESTMTNEQTYTTAGELNYVGPFKNHLNSTVMVSPAQIYQIGDLRTDWQLGVDAAKSKVGPTETKTNLTDINGAVVYNFTPYDVRAGLKFNYGLGTQKVTGATDVDVSTWTVEPTFAMPAGDFVVGLGFGFTGVENSQTGATDKDATFTRIKPAVAYVGSNYEVGAVFASKVKEDAKAADELDAFVPATTTIHGRFAATETFAVGGIIENRAYKTFNSAVLKDQIGLTATTEFDQGTYKLEGTLGYNSKFYKGSAVTQDTIATTELGFAGDYRMGKAATVGGSVTYGFGSEEESATKYKVQDLAFGVRTNFTF